MQIVIDIPEDVYDYIKANGARIPYHKLTDVIKNGTPLPKGHGRLIDGEEIASKIDGLKDNWNRYGNEYESGRYESYDYAVDEIVDAPIIIEADKESEG